MAAVSTQEKSTLAVRIRNGQTTSGEWKYTNVNIAHVKADFSVETDAVKIMAVYNAIVTGSILVGTLDGVRAVLTYGIANEE